MNEQVPSDVRVTWYERLLVEWAAVVMDDEDFDAFLDRYGFEISADFKVVRRHG